MMLLDALLAMYFGFGIGMCSKLLSQNNILFKGWAGERDVEELTQPQYTLFVFVFCLIWPLRFVSYVRVAFMTKEKKTGLVLPL